MLLFDRRDRQLLKIVNEVLSKDPTRQYRREMVYPYLHPRGIKELSESKGLRVAFAIIHLLESMEEGGVNDRLNALRSLRDEVLLTAAGPIPKNTARVLLQIMKELVRAHGSEHRQLELAHDFRACVSGNPRVIRGQLRKYHLLEMPEEWNQLSFDDHVHDANTKGRKSSSHLIMDAWIKGIRRLRVIYYNYLEARFAVEILEAARIMGIDIRIGIEFYATFRDRYIQLIWVPRGFSDAQDFLWFLEESSVKELMAEGKSVCSYQKEYVLSILDAFNRNHGPAIQKSLGFEVPSLSVQEFLSFVRTGQPSLVHLAEFAHAKMLPPMAERVRTLQESYPKAPQEERLEIAHLVQTMNRMDSDNILEQYLLPEKNPQIPDPNKPQPESDAPGLLRLSPKEIISRLSKLHQGYRITLNLSGLQVEDVLELLYDCEGSINRLEIFNLKDYAAGKTEQVPEICQLQQAINRGNVIQLKKLTRDIIGRLASPENDQQKDRIDKLSDILHDIAILRDFYKASPLKARIGSDSTGRSPRVHGMGLAILDTLPRRALRAVGRTESSRDHIPIAIGVLKRRTVHPKKGPTPFTKAFYRFVRHIPGMESISSRKTHDWLIEEESTRYTTDAGNVITLGGVQKHADNGFTLTPRALQEKAHRLSWRYLNTGFKNFLKILIGFIPAFATFSLTKDWWFLAYFGAFIWFGITGLRNVLQSVLGGGGIRRSPLLRWNDYVKWERLADSLLFTGFSVPLLDYVAKTLVLKELFGITTASNPVLLYSFMALTNGLYLCSHNIFRGLPKGAVYGNLFRSVLSIPVALLFNWAAAGVLTAFHVPGVDIILQKWAAVISKGASDLVAGMIEGLADRYQNIQTRLRDYRTKMEQIFETYARVELLFPETNTLEILKSPGRLSTAKSSEIRDLGKILIIFSLDLLYFWMYQPRARSAWKLIMQSLTREERRIAMGSQQILTQQKRISLLIVEGLLGKHFSKALSFYLDCFQEYLDSQKKIMERMKE
ncbi:conserved hypothetical protein [delta proteobacterium NaphS2]|nr:conserved hypothetical protein [delta proteobacterium NaphS2]